MTDLTPHPDSRLVREAIERADLRGEEPAVRRYDWQPGDATRYDFLVTWEGGSHPLVVVTWINAPGGVCSVAMWRWDWHYASIDVVKSMLPDQDTLKRKYNAAALLRFVWAILGDHPDGSPRDHLSAAGVIR